MKDIPRVLESAIRKLGMTNAEAHRNKNYETALVGCQLCYLRECDVIYMLSDSTTDTQAQNRLTYRRRVS